MTALRGTRIGVIGAGTMGQALLRGFLARGVSRRSLRAAETHAATRRSAQRRLRVSVVADARSVARWADVVILAVKPQQFPSVIPAIAGSLRRRPLVISIAAGIRLRWLSRHLPGVPLARVMPNLPAVVQQGFSAITFARGVGASHRKAARALFESVGQVVELPEGSFDAITAVSGSGPAYVFFLADAWGQAARRAGLSPKVAAQAIAATLEGSVRLLVQSGEDPAGLVKQVASKGGTTEAALKVLSRRRVAASLVEAVQAAARRSRALAWS